MNLYELLGRVVAWLFIAGVGAFAVFMVAALVISVIDDIKERRRNERR